MRGPGHGARPITSSTQVVDRGGQRWGQREDPLLSVRVSLGTFHLRLGSTRITDTAIAKLADLKLPIVSMDISYTDITDSCVRSLLRFPELQSVEIVETDISKAAVESLEAAGIQVLGTRGRLNR